MSGAAPASSTTWPSTYHCADSPRSTSDLDVILSAMHGHNIVHLLDKGDEQIRSRVLAAVNKDVHLVMVHPLGCDVFQALLRCCAGHYEKLWSIVQALATTNDYRTWRCKPSDDRTWFAFLCFPVCLYVYTLGIGVRLLSRVQNCRLCSPEYQYQYLHA
jgi:hypothetical protein